MTSVKFQETLARGIKKWYNVQKSVFEGMITEGKLNQLKAELGKLIKCSEDTVCIYKIQNLKFTSKEKIGVIRRNDNIL